LPPNGIGAVNKYEVLGMVAYIEYIATINAVNND